MTGKKAPQILTRPAIGEVAAQQAFDGFRDLGREAAKSDRPRNRLIQAERTAQAEVVGVHHVAVDLDLLAFDSDVGDPVLSATVGAAGDVQFQVLIKSGQAFFQFFHQPARKAFRLGDGQLAELRTAAGDGSAPKRRPAHRANRSHLVLLPNRRRAAGAH